MKKKIILGLAIVFIFGFTKNVQAIEWTNIVYQAPLDIILPDNYTNKDLRFPVLYLLHGRNQDYDVWYYNSILDEQMKLANRDFIVVMPSSGGNSWYQNAAKLNYFRSDLPAFIEQNFRASKLRGIGGISMGGYGAFHISGQSDTVYIKDYKSVSSMSGGFIEPDEADLLDGITIDSPNTLAQNIAPKDFRIYMDCGAEDVFGGWIFSYSLRDKNVEMKDLLLGYGRTLETNLFFYLPPGKHNWDYWNSRIPDHLDFHNRRFNKYPMLSITSFPENVTTTVDNDNVRVAGICLRNSSVTNLTYKIETSDKTTRGNVTGISNWYFDVKLESNKSDIKINTVTENGFDTFAKLTLKINKYPEITVTSFPENVTTVVNTNIVRIAGVCYANFAITGFTYKVDATDKVTKGNVTGTSNWFFDVMLDNGNNNIKITAVTSQGLSSNAKLTLFRRNTSFRVRKVIVNEKSIVAKTSDVTYGDMDVFTNGMNGIGYFKFGDINLPVTNLWKRTGEYVVKYKENTDDYKFTIKVNGKAQKDFTKLNFKWKNKSLIKTNLLDFVTLNSNNIIEVRFGFYGDGTNVFLEEKNEGEKGKFKWDGKWF